MARLRLLVVMVMVAVVTVSGPAQAEDEPRDVPLSSCVLKRAKELRFPAPDHGGEVDISYPLYFAPPDGE